MFEIIVYLDDIPCEEWVTNSRMEAEEIANSREKEWVSILDSIFDPEVTVKIFEVVHA